MMDDGSGVETGETSSELQKIISSLGKKVQQTLGVRSNVDAVILVRSLENHYSIVGMATTTLAGETSCVIDVPENVLNNGKIGPDEINGLRHELGHAVFGAYELPRRTGVIISEIMEEGIVEMANLAGGNENILQISRTCGDGVQANSELLQNLMQSNVQRVPGGLPTVDVGYGPIAERQRNILNVAGIALVAEVLGKENVYKWPVMWQNPPTADEIISDRLGYKDRIKKELEEFVAPSIMPKDIKLKSAKDKGRVI